MRTDSLRYDRVVQDESEPLFWGELRAGIDSCREAIYV